MVRVSPRVFPRCATKCLEIETIRHLTAETSTTVLPERGTKWKRRVARRLTDSCGFHFCHKYSIARELHPLPPYLPSAQMAPPVTVLQGAGNAAIRPRFETRAVARPPFLSLPARPCGFRLDNRLPNDFLGRQLAIESRSRGQCRGKRRAGTVSSLRDGGGGDEPAVKSVGRLTEKEDQRELASRIASGEFTVGPARLNLLKVRAFLIKFGGLGRALAKFISVAEQKWRAQNFSKMPEARGNVRAVVGQPFFIPLYDLYLTYGGVFQLTFGPKSFVIVSDPTVAKHILKDNSKSYSKGILAEILDFLMGKGLIPADGAVWRVRRKVIVPALHRKYVAAMLDLFGRAAGNLCKKLDVAAIDGEDVEMESLFSRLTLDVIGKAVFNYEFDSLAIDTGIVEAVYDVLREAEDRSVAVIPYWNIPIWKDLSPRQRKVSASLKLINDTLDDLINICKRTLEEEDVQFHEEYVNERDPSILHFLLASGDDVSSKQLRDDLMTMLIAGHETSAAVLTWTFYLLAQNPGVTSKLQNEVDAVLGDRLPTIEDMKKLKYATRVINEALRLYPQPPVLIRRALDDDVLGGYPIKKGEDIFICVWNLHRSPHLWVDSDKFKPERWPIDGPDPNESTENFRYLPFGGGPRKCVGDMFATFETVTALAMLIRRFKFELAVGAPPVGMTTGATIHTTAGLKMTVTHRTRPPVIPVMETPTLTTIDQSGTIKSYKATDGSVSVFTPETQDTELDQRDVHKIKCPTTYPQSMYYS